MKLSFLGLFLDMMMTAGEQLLQREPLGVKNIKDMFSYMTYEPDSDGCLMTKTINTRGIAPKAAIDEIQKRLLNFEELYYQNLFAHFQDKKRQNV